MFSKVIDLLTLKQWIKFFLIIVAGVLVYKDPVSFINATLENPIIPPVINNPVQPSNLANNAPVKPPVQPAQPPRTSTRKIRFKIDLDYEIVTSQKATVPPPRVALLSAPILGFGLIMPPIKTLRIQGLHAETNSILSVIDSDYNSYLKIQSLWDIYCSDPIIFNECEKCRD